MTKSELKYTPIGLNGPFITFMVELKGVYFLNFSAFCTDVDKLLLEMQIRGHCVDNYKLHNKCVLSNLKIIIIIIIIIIKHCNDK